MPDPDFSFLSNEQNNDVLAGIGAGLQSYDPNNMFAGAGAAISANTASRVKREEPYRQFQASLKNKKILQDMYAGKKANITDFGRLTENFKAMMKEMFGKARPVADVPPVDVVAEQMKAFYDENVRNEPLMQQSMENDPEWKRRGGVNNPPEDYSTDDPEWERRGGVNNPPDNPEVASEEDWQSNQVEREAQGTDPESDREKEDRRRLLDFEADTQISHWKRVKEEEDFLQNPKYLRQNSGDYQSDDAEEHTLVMWREMIQSLPTNVINEIDKQRLLREGRDYLANAKKRRWALRTGKVGN